jgi:hypothetical protein
MHALNGEMVPDSAFVKAMYQVSAPAMTCTRTNRPVLARVVVVALAGILFLSLFDVTASFVFRPS